MGSLTKLLTGRAQVFLRRADLSSVPDTPGVSHTDLDNHLRTEGAMTPQALALSFTSVQGGLLPGSRSFLSLT